MDTNLLRSLSKEKLIGLIEEIAALQEEASLRLIQSLLSTHCTKVGDQKVNKGPSSAKAPRQFSINR